jgi:FkbM family methyltransferase
VAEAGVALLHSEDPDPRTNCELRVLERMADRLDTVIDVGANHGQWSRLALMVSPGVRVCCSEIVSSTRAKLRAALPQATVVDYGLSDRSATVEVKHYLADDRLSSLYDYPHPLRAVLLREEVRTGDELLAAEKIERVDLLKVDAEGADLAVLRGFSQALAEGRINAVQFEYGYACVLARSFLLDFYELLEPRGFQLGRVGRRGVEFMPYRLERENFFGPNFLAVRSDDAGLLARLES